MAIMVQPNTVLAELEHWKPFLANMDLLAIVQQANKDKAALAKQIDNATKQMGIEIRALRRIQDRQLEAAGILPSSSKKD